MAKKAHKISYTLIVDIVTFPSKDTLGTATFMSAVAKAKSRTTNIVTHIPELSNYCLPIVSSILHSCLRMNEKLFAVTVVVAGKRYDSACESFLNRGRTVFKHLSFLCNHWENIAILWITLESPIILVFKDSNFKYSTLLCIATFLIFFFYFIQFSLSFIANLNLLIINFLLERKFIYNGKYIRS